MNSEQIIEAFQDRGIALSVTPEYKLRVDGEESDFNPDLIAFLKGNRDAIIDKLCVYEFQSEVFRLCYVGDKHRPVYAFAPGAKDEIESDDESIRWYLPTGGPYNPSSIVYQGRYYTLYDRGFLTCHDAKTGEEIYGKQRFPGGASFTSSPWAYNGKIFCLSEDGETFVVEAGDEFNVLQQNDLDELCLATPAMAQGKLLIRTASQLYCLTKQ